MATCQLSGVQQPYEFIEQAAAKISRKFPAAFRNLLQSLFRNYAQ